MQSGMQLGMSLGQMLAGMFDNSNRQKGELAGADILYKNPMADKAQTEALKTQQEMDNSSDDGIAKTLLAGIGANSEGGLNDFKSTLAGTYQPPVKPLAFTDGGAQLPAPEYVSKFPELQKQYSVLKQMLALGDKDITHIPKYEQGNQRNALTANLGSATPQQAAEIGQRTAALEGNVNPLEMQKAAILYGLANGDNGLDKQNAMLLSQGKTRFDNTGDVGTMDLLTGLQKLNQIGTTAAAENKAQANQANAGANENNAQAVLATTRSQHIKDGKGDGSQAPFKVDGSYQSALGNPALDEKGRPVVDTFTGRQIVNRNVKEEENFLKWASDNKYPSTDAALGAYIAQGRPRSTQKNYNPAYDEYLAAYNQAKGRPEIQKKITERARKNGVVK